MDKTDKLYKTYIHLLEVKGQCSCDVLEQLNVSELTLKQIQYIKKINEYECITTSELAENLNLSKPSVTEMIKKFSKLDCVYKKQCEQDGRVQYIHLTDRGKSIATIEDIQLKNLIDRIIRSLAEDEIDSLINLLLKIK